MKKIFSIIMAAAMICCALLAFTACGGEDNTLDMATNATFPPYEYKDGDNFAGIDVEIAGLIAEKLGMELKIHDIEFGSIVSGVQTGKFDMGMAGLTVTEERKQSVDFSTSYAKGIQAVIVKADSEYTSYEDFYTGYDDEGNPTGVVDGIKIGVQQDTTGDIYCSSKPEEWGFGEDNVVRYKAGNDAVQALVSGKVTAVIIDNEPAKSYVASNEGLKILETSYTEEDYAICVSKDNKDLLEQINKALAELTEAGEIQKIVDKYIGK